MASVSKHQEQIRDEILLAIDKHPVGLVFEVGLTIMAKLAANIREAGIVSDRALIAAFIEAMDIAFTPTSFSTPVIRLHKEEEMLH